MKRGALADVTAAATGGLLVPVAAALNLAGASHRCSLVAYQDEKTDDAQGLGLNPDGTTNTSRGTETRCSNIQRRSIHRFRICW
jgi:hypothetical protein